MKIQFIIFFLVLGVIIYLVYPEQKETQEVQTQQQTSWEEKQSQWKEDSTQIHQEDNASSPDLQEQEEVEAQQPEENWENTMEVFDDSVSSVETFEQNYNLQLPSSLDYWDPLRTGENSFIYNQVKGLEITQKSPREAISCDDITEFLSQELQGWFYWNTCRPITTERWWMFYVIRLVDEKYVYEKHYFDEKTGIHASLLLETWEGVTKDNISEKNQELKNQEYEIAQVGDALMREILNNNP